MTRALCTFCACLALTSVVGCGFGDGPQSGNVRFKVDGSPVTSGKIEFRRVGDLARFNAVIQNDGTFQPSDQDGVIGLPPGNYDVVVIQIVLTEDLQKFLHTHGHTVDTRHAAYETSDLTYEVAEGQTADIEIEVEAAPEPEE